MAGRVGGRRRGFEERQTGACLLACGSATISASPGSAPSWQPAGGPCQPDLGVCFHRAAQAGCQVLVLQPLLQGERRQTGKQAHRGRQSLPKTWQQGGCARRMGGSRWQQRPLPRPLCREGGGTTELPAAQAAWRHLHRGPQWHAQQQHPPAARSRSLGHPRPAGTGQPAQAALHPNSASGGQKRRGSSTSRRPPATPPAAGCLRGARWCAGSVPAIHSSGSSSCCEEGSAWASGRQVAAAAAVGGPRAACAPFAKLCAAKTTTLVADGDELSLGEHPFRAFADGPARVELLAARHGDHRMHATAICGIERCHAFWRATSKLERRSAAAAAA